MSAKTTASYLKIEAITGDRWHSVVLRPALTAPYWVRRSSCHLKRLTPWKNVPGTWLSERNVWTFSTHLKREAIRGHPWQ